jgi:uncharacterized membrane protein
VTEPPQTQHSPQDLSATAESAPTQTDEQAHAAHRRSVLAGLGYGALAYGSWGFIAFYFKAVAAVDPLEVLCHRIVWSVGILALLVWVTKRWGECRDLLRLTSTWRSISVSTVLIAINWLVFIYAVASGRLVEASLGYFINPLVSIVLGMVFLGERLRRLQWIAVAFAIAGVAIYTWQVGTLPWISLTLAGVSSASTARPQAGQGGPHRRPLLRDHAARSPSPSPTSSSCPSQACERSSSGRPLPPTDSPRARSRRWTCCCRRGPRHDAPAALVRRRRPPAAPEHDRVHAVLARRRSSS